MSKELDDEIEDGKVAALSVVKHMERMGQASDCRIPVSFVDGHGNLTEWEVSAKLVSIISI